MSRLKRLEVLESRLSPFVPKVWKIIGKHDLTESDGDCIKRCGYDPADTELNFISLVPLNVPAKNEVM